MELDSQELQEFEKDINPVISVVNLPSTSNIVQEINYSATDALRYKNLVQQCAQYSILEEVKFLGS